MIITEYMENGSLDTFLKVRQWLKRREIHEGLKFDREEEKKRRKCRTIEEKECK